MPKRSSGYFENDENVTAILNKNRQISQKCQKFVVTL